MANIDLDLLLGDIERRPLGDQISELWKNDAVGTPHYIRGVVLTKAEYDRVLKSTYKIPPVLFSSASPLKWDEPAPKKKAPPQWWEDGGWG